MTVEYVGQMRPKPLTSLEEDFKRDREQFRKDELDRALRRSGKLAEPEPETTYARFPMENDSEWATQVEKALQAKW